MQVPMSCGLGPTPAQLLVPESPAAPPVGVHPGRGSFISLELDFSFRVDDHFFSGMSPV